MGKRSDFKRRPQDAYDTPYAPAVPRLLPFLGLRIRFAEPCGGRGDLMNHLQKHGHVCEYACDIRPRSKNIFKRDAMKWFDGSAFDYIITNPPWSRPLLHPMIDHFREIAPTWLLLDADWMHTKQAVPYLDYCSKIVSVGRVKWITGSKNTGKDNACWYLFTDSKCYTTFYGWPS